MVHVQFLVVEQRRVSSHQFENEGRETDPGSGTFWVPEAITGSHLGLGEHENGRCRRRAQSN
jgi:hypothetical protein